jgi:alkanesulfonate monooxygenase SsuD/methylene tetrahydromethanopterin reductase-like flavin-dependent oxidoreductase (luciferase family)
MTKKVDVFRRKQEILQHHCQQVGRAFSSIRTALTVPVFLDTNRGAAEQWAGDRLTSKDPPFAGTPDDLRRYLQAYVDLGVTMFHMVFPGFPETHDIQLFADEVLPAFVP